MRSRLPSNRKNARARNRARFLAPARSRRARRFLETDAVDDGAGLTSLVVEIIDPISMKNIEINIEAQSFSFFLFFLFTVHWKWFDAVDNFNS